MALKIRRINLFKEEEKKNVIKIKRIEKNIAWKFYEWYDAPFDYVIFYYNIMMMAIGNGASW